MTALELNPAYVEAVKEMLTHTPYFELLGMKLEALSPGVAEFVITAQKKHLNSFKRVQGGVLASILDATTFWAGYSLVPEGKVMTTAELKINYLGNCTEGEVLEVKGNAIKVGRKLGVAEARMSEKGSGRLVGFGTATCMVLNEPLTEPFVSLPDKFLPQ